MYYLVKTASPALEQSIVFKLTSSSTAVIAVSKYRSTNSGGPLTTIIASTGTTYVAAIPAPTANTGYIVESIQIFNGDAAAQTVTVSLLDAGPTPDVYYEQAQVTLLSGQTLQYTHEDGWLPVLVPIASGSANNLIIGGGLDFFQRVTPTAATPMTNDVYNAPDRWYSLIDTSTNKPTIQRVETGDSARYAAKMIAGTDLKRFGIAQIVEASNSIPLQGRTVIAQARVRATRGSGSAATPIRIALLEWTGTADSVTSELVANWASSTYTTAGFFASDSGNKTLVGTAVVSPTDATWADIYITGNVSVNCKNLIMFIWVQDAPTNAADYIEISECGIYDGGSLRDWLPRPIGEELALCQRYYCKSYDIDIAPGTSGTSGGYGGVVFGVAQNANYASNGNMFPVRMRIAPTSTVLYDPAASNTIGVMRDGNLGNSTSSGFVLNTIGDRGFANAYKAGGGLTAGLSYYYAFTADAEL